MQRVKTGFWIQHSNCKAFLLLHQIFIPCSSLRQHLLPFSSYFFYLYITFKLFFHIWCLNSNPYFLMFELLYWTASLMFYIYSAFFQVWCVSFYSSNTTYIRIQCYRRTFIGSFQPIWYTHYLGINCLSQSCFNLLFEYMSQFLPNIHSPWAKLICSW